MSATTRNPQPETSLDKEVTLLRIAHEQLRAGQAQRAVETLRIHAERYPRGALHEMRKVTRIMALCALHKVDAARHEAEQFLEEYGSSPYAARVRTSCNGAAPSSQNP